MIINKNLLLLIFLFFSIEKVNASNFADNITLTFNNTNLCINSSYTVTFTSSLPIGTPYKLILEKNGIEKFVFYSNTSPIYIYLAQGLEYGTDYSLKITTADGAVQSNILANITVGVIQSNANIANQDGHFLEVYKQVCTGAIVPLEAAIYKNYEKLSGITYQWQKDNVNIGTNENPILVSEGGNYKVIASQGGCVKTSGNVTLVYGSIIQKNTDLENNIGFCEDAQTKVSAQYRSTTATYQWKLNDNDIPGETDRSIIPKITGNYSVAITDKICSNTSTPVNIKLGTSLFADIFSQEGLTLCGGNFINLNLGFSSNLYLQRFDSYKTNPQWQKDGVDIPNAIGFNYPANAAGIYRLKLKQGTCESFSNEIVLTNGAKLDKPTLYSPQNKYPPICSGSYSIYWFANNNPKIYRDDVFLTNGNFVNATITGVYKVVVGEGTSCENSSVPLNISIGTELLPTISTKKTELCGTNDVTSLNFDFTGNATMNYQWQKNQVDLGISTNSLGVYSTQPGNYRLKVINGSCEAFSNEISITRNDIGPFDIKPFFGYDYTNLNCSNKLAILTFEVGSTGHKWYKNGIEIPNENSNRLLTPHAGTYTASVTGIGCTATSNPFIINSDYVPQPTITQSPTQVGASATLTASGCDGNINWYDVSTSGSPLGSGTTFNTPILNATASYFADCATANCKSAREKIDVLLNGCTSMTSLKSGSWYEPSLWSCGRVPIVTDQIIINSGHLININYGDVTIKSLEHNGSLTIKNSAKLIFQ